MLSVFIYTFIMCFMFCCASIASYREHVTVHKNLFFRWEIILMLLSFAVVFGMRYDVGKDHLSYLDGYINPSLHKEYEPLFALLNDTLSNEGIHPVIFFAICAFIQVFCLFYFMKDRKFLYPSLVVSLFMGQFFIHWMNGIRQDIAGCVFLCSITYIVNKKYIMYLFFVLISVGFHYSAILLFPLCFLYLKKDCYFNNFYIQYLLLSIVSIVAIRDIDLLSSMSNYIFYFSTLLGYEIYTENVLEKFADITKTGMSMYALILLDFIIVSYYRKLRFYYCNRKFNIIYDLYFFGTVLQTLFINNLVLARPFRYFRGCKLIIIAYLLFFLYKKGGVTVNTVVFFMVMILLLILFIATIKNEPFYFMSI